MKSFVDCGARAEGPSEDWTAKDEDDDDDTASSDETGARPCTRTALDLAERE